MKIAGNAKANIVEACQRQKLAKLFAKLPNWMSTRVKIADKLQRQTNWELDREWVREYVIERVRESDTRMSMSFEFVYDYWHARRLPPVATIKYKLRIRRVCARAALLQLQIQLIPRDKYRNLMYLLIVQV